ncbi:hypothetical protein GW844_03735 [bacterium]|nr:hypothetical protein [bacterium]
MDDLLGYLLILVIIVGLFTLGFAISSDINLTGNAIGSYSGIYCHPSGCNEGQVSRTGYLYPGDTEACPDETSVFRYFLPGKVLIPVYQSYYLFEATCHITMD